MNALNVLVAFGLFFFIIEVLFFIYCFRWLASSKRQREKDFERLDKETANLLTEKHYLKLDINEARILAEGSVEKLKLLGANIHAEWADIQKQMTNLYNEIKLNSNTFINEYTIDINKHKLILEKLCKIAKETENNLKLELKDIQKILKFFDKNINIDELIKDIRAEKYSEATNLLNQGFDASVVSEKLGVSMSEMTLISHLRN